MKVCKSVPSVVYDRRLECGHFSEVSDMSIRRRDVSNFAFDLGRVKDLKRESRYWRA
jgi:hypothetical protein